MTWRFRFYAWFFDRPGLVARWIITNAALFFAGGLMSVLLDLALGPLDLRWGLTVWYSFIMAFSFVVFFNVGANLLGLGYEEWRDRGQAR